ncbi:MAG TPA: 3-oxoadipyl-CoA thiolase, partial [Candidatus Paceibacterota bacterium]
WGGAIAIGHPLGASGTRIVGALAHQLGALGEKTGIAVACNGGGEAVAVMIERV